MNTPYRTILIVACSLALSGASLFASVNDFARSDIANFNGDSLGFRGQATVSSTNAVAGRTFAMADPGEAALLRSVAEPSLTCEAEAVGIRGLLQ